MCLIVFKPRGVVVPDDHLREGFDSNRDGWGIAYIGEEGKVQIRKSVSGYAHFKETYDHIVDVSGKDFPILVHFRLATHGARDSSMCHPFYGAGGWMAVAHNGILNDYAHPAVGENDSHLSDTARFLRKRLDPLVARSSESEIFSHEFRQALGREVGHYNKLCLLTKGGGFSIINDDAGHWEGGVWYSNHGYKARSYVVEGYGHGGWDSCRDWKRDRKRLWKPSTYKDDPTPSNMKKFVQGQIECDLCGDHVKGDYYMEYGDESLHVFCPVCASDYMQNMVDEDDTGSVSGGEVGK